MSNQTPRMSITAILNNSRKNTAVTLKVGGKSTDISLQVDNFDDDTESVTETIITKMSLTGAKRLRHALDSIIKTQSLK